MREIELNPTVKRFVLHWGEMGTRWGINRTVAQIHALLYLSERPLHAEEIAQALSVARSNVSGSLRELQGWGIVRVVHVLGDRRDHFESLSDVWEMFRIIVEERKRREVDPTISMLRSCLQEPVGKDDKYVQARLAEMTEFFETMLSFYEDARHVPPKALRQFVKMRAGMSLLIPKKGKAK
jgi:DNA-binding transcriptional regulator GbsR (MarR family)